MRRGQFWTKKIVRVGAFFSRSLVRIKWVVWMFEASSPGCCPLDIGHITIWSAEIIGELLTPILKPSATCSPPLRVDGGWKWTPDWNAISWTLFYLSSVSEKIFDPEHYILGWSGGTNRGQLALLLTAGWWHGVQSIPECLVNNLSGITDKCSFYTHSCHFPWYLTTIVFHVRGSGVFICSEGRSRVCYFRPHPPIWSQLMSTFLWDNPQNQLNSSPRPSLQTLLILLRFFSVLSPSVNRHYPGHLLAPSSYLAPVSHHYPLITPSLSSLSWRVFGY